MVSLQSGGQMSRSHLGSNMCWWSHPCRGWGAGVHFLVTFRIPTASATTLCSQSTYCSCLFSFSVVLVTLLRSELDAVSPGNHSGALVGQESGRNERSRGQCLEDVDWRIFSSVWKWLHDYQGQQQVVVVRLIGWDQIMLGLKAESHLSLNIYAVSKVEQVDYVKLVSILF